jgi:hypothetical protein
MIEFDSLQILWRKNSNEEMQELKQVLDTWMIGGSEIPLFVQNLQG